MFFQTTRARPFALPLGRARPGRVGPPPDTDGLSGLHLQIQGEEGGNCQANVHPYTNLGMNRSARVGTQFPEAP